MIIRRRTYIKQFTDRYGYFMRNFNYYQGYSGGSASAGATLATNIYTKCMQKEAPVGTFPLSYRTATSALSSSGSSPRYIAVGETDGSVIYVVTAKSVYKSTNGGANFSLTTSNWNSATYVSSMTGPIVYVDDSYLYILHTELTYPSDTSCYYYLRLIKINRSNNIVASTTTLDTIYQTWSSGSSNSVGAPFSNDYGSFFSQNVSPRGQVMIFHKVYNDRRCWKVYDLVRSVASGVVTIYSNAGTISFDMWEASGEWFDDGSTYGKFFFGGTNISETTPTYYSKFYKTIALSQFSSGATFTITDIRSSLGPIVSDHCSYYTSGQYAGSLDSEPRIFIASCQKAYKNKLFIYGFEGNVYKYYVYVCDASFGNKVQIAIDKDKVRADLNDAIYNHPGQIAGICVTPDGNYGVVLWNYAALTFDLRTNTYFGGYDFESADGNGAQYYRSEGTCFMLPKSVSNV